MQLIELQDQERIGGGLTWSQVGVGIAVCGLAVSIAATGGLSGIAIGVIAGAGAGADLAIAGTALTLSGIGGALIGRGMSQ